MRKGILVFGVLLLVLSIVLVAGFLNQANESNRKETVKWLVTDAADLVEVQGEDAFAEFRQSGTKWFQGDTYIFVWQTDGLRLVYPPDINGEGQNMSALVDSAGKPIGKLFIDIALSKQGEGWIEYQWPKPQETQPSAKLTYIKGVQMGNETLLVGSGLYVQTLNGFFAPLQYVAIAIEAAIAAIGLLIAVRHKRPFGYGIALTFLIYVFYDLARLTSPETSELILYPVFFVATLSMLWAVILLYKEKTTKTTEKHKMPPKQTQRIRINACSLRLT